jgi:Predicted transcriptional regulator/sugar kinase
VDLIPFSGGRLLNQGFSDAECMREDELVYIGVVRMSLMVIARTIVFKGCLYRVVVEYFAISADVYRIIGELMEMEDMVVMVDGVGKIREVSMRRLACMLGHDFEDVEDVDW